MKINLLFFAMLLGGGLALTQADEPMVKIVYRAVAPELSPDSFAAKPKTLYRWGATRSRTEEAPDPAMKLQELLISNGKDIWLINLWDKTGRHIIDPGPTYNAHAPIVPSDHRGKPPRVADFEIGHELAYMTAHHIQPIMVTTDGVPAVLYETIQEGLKLRLYLTASTQTPMEVSVDEGDHCLVRLFYQEYSTNLTPDPSLFQVPPSVQISEVPQQ